MHFCVAIISEQFPANEELEEILKPYDEKDYWGDMDENDELKEKKPRPAFMWDWWVVGGRYGGKIKLRVDKENEEYRWGFIDKERKSARLFRSYILDEIHDTKAAYFEDETYYWMGWRDNFLYVDGAKVKDVLNMEECMNTYAFIGKNNEIYVRSRWDGEKYVDDEQYDEKVKEAIKNTEDCWVCIVDCHT